MTVVGACGSTTGAGRGTASAAPHGHLAVVPASLSGAWWRRPQLEQVTAIGTEDAPETIEVGTWREVRRIFPSYLSSRATTSPCSSRSSGRVLNPPTRNPPAKLDSEIPLDKVPAGAVQESGVTDEIADSAGVDQIGLMGTQAADVVFALEDEPGHPAVG